MGMDSHPDEEPEEVPADVPAEGPDAPQELPPPKDSPAHRQPHEPRNDPRSPSEVRADLLQQTESGWNPDHKFEAPRKELAEFNLKRAGLPEMSFEEADKYVEEHRAARPWLSMTDKASPEARRIIAAMDAAGGHAHIRHEGWVTEEANMRRVVHREDPAQLDPEKRRLSKDGLRPNGNLHRCADTATRITDPDAFATAFVRGVEHPRVRAALDMTFDPADSPDYVIVPISDLLGPKGQKHCTGWRLKEVDGSMDTARAMRNDWVKKRSQEQPPNIPEPEIAPVSTFEGGSITFVFSGNETERRYEVLTMHPDPPMH